MPVPHVPFPLSQVPAPPVAGYPFARKRATVQEKASTPRRESKQAYRGKGIPITQKANNRTSESEFPYGRKRSPLGVEAGSPTREGDLPYKGQRVPVVGEAYTHTRESDHPLCIPDCPLSLTVHPARETCQASVCRVLSMNSTGCLGKPCDSETSDLDPKLAWDAKGGGVGSFRDFRVPKLEAEAGNQR